MIIIQAKLKGIKEFVTGWRLVFQIPNTVLTDDQKIIILQANGNDGFLTFSPDALKGEIEGIMKNRKIGASEEGKSKSEILRGTLYRYWQAVSPGNIPAEDFYNEKMDGIINKLKQAIEKIDIDRLDDYYKDKKV